MTGEQLVRRLAKDGFRWFFDRDDAIRARRKKETKATKGVLFCPISAYHFLKTGEVTDLDDAFITAINQPYSEDAELIIDSADENYPETTEYNKRAAQLRQMMIDLLKPVKYNPDET